MIKIPLSQGKYAVIDDNDYQLVSKHKWYTKNCTRIFYARTNLHIGRNRRSILYMHRLIMDAPKEMQVDHIDNDGLNNQRKNLRICTVAENTRNSRKHSQNKSGYKGVWFNNACGPEKPWVSAITLNGKAIHIGVFSSPEEAALAYNKKALELFGEFASLNTVKL
jgi:hypothetical protein